MYKFNGILFAVLGLLMVLAFFLNPVLGAVAMLVTIGVYIWSIRTAAAYHLQRRGADRQMTIAALMDLEIDPAVASFSRGKFRYQTENYQLAIEDFNRAIDLNERYIEAIYYRGLSWQKLTKLETAKVDLKYALSLCDRDMNRDLYRQIESQLKEIAVVEDSPSNEFNNVSTSA